MFVSNDPYVGTPHQPDTIMAAPVFVGDELFCWVANVMHHADVGGSVMGSFCVDAADMFTDPPAFPPFKLVSRGEVRGDLEEMFLRQSRVPTEVHMDLRAAISANRVAVGRIAALADRYGADAVKAVMNRALDAGERTIAQRLSKIPDGRWSQRVYAEAARTGDTGIYTYQITVRKQGEHLYVDNAGTDPQTGSINVTYAGFSGAFLAALTASLTADLAGAYGGVYRRVHFEPVPGTLSCADFPAAVSPAGIYTMETLISLSGAVIGKMLACAEPEVARLAIGPAHPVFYGFIAGGMYPTGEPFVATNADNMIGSLAASPAGDGVDFGGHFWIPEGTASNIEELELLWPMLFLYRRALRAGADGAGRFRGGRGFVEAGLPWTVPGLAAAVYVDESFPKAVGPFGANPASAGHFRLKRGTDVIARLAGGEVPQDFDAIDGAEAEVEAKGPMLMMGADSAWEWTGANAPGFGDPLSRDPGQVEADIAAGALSPGAAERCTAWYPATRRDRGAAHRAHGRTARRGRPPAGTPATVPAGVPLRVLAANWLVRTRRPPRGVRDRHRPSGAAPASGNYKDGWPSWNARCTRWPRNSLPGGPGRLPRAIPRVPVPGHRPARGLRDHRRRRRGPARHRPSGTG